MASAEVDQGIAEGWIAPGAGGRLPPVRRGRSERLILDVIADDRGE